MKIRESSTFEYVMQPIFFLGGQVRERAVYQVMNFGNAEGTWEKCLGILVSPRGWHKIFQREEGIPNMLCHLMA